MKPLVLLLASAWLPAADLAAVKAEPNLERRSDRALANAESALDDARKAYLDNDDKRFEAALAEVDQSMALCKESLEKSGKNARRSPKYFKKAEIGFRHLIRRLDNFRQELSVDDRAPAERLLVQANKLQEDILHMIMGKK